jgi:hypothetical protein
LEEPWSDEYVELIRVALHRVIETAEHHEFTAHALHRKDVMWGLPHILIPIIMSPLSMMADFEQVGNLKYIHSAMFLVSGLTSAVHSYFAFATKTDSHFLHSTKYYELASDIEIQLSKSVQFREPVDTVMLKIQMTRKFLAQSGPNIPTWVVELHQTGSKQDKLN